ncbi:hypothetical protein HZS_3384 [Henneguya salminicola]|nr:hypothetical protein HZS_3384 [Henneguya salminicola]
MELLPLIPYLNVFLLNHDDIAIADRTQNAFEKYNRRLNDHVSNAQSFQFREACKKTLIRTKRVLTKLV